jgi:hypothetical protein
LSKASRSALALVLPGLLAVGDAYGLARYGLSRRSASGSPGADAPVVIRSLAVRPLDNYSGDSTQEYFAEGMTDEVTAALATISQLRVTSRGSAMQFHGRNRPATPQIAKALDVDASMQWWRARCLDPATRCGSQPS